jgi:hypothetical protein
VCYCSKDNSTTPLQEAAKRGDVVTIESLLTAGAAKKGGDWNGASSLKLATDEACITLLKHHRAACISVEKDFNSLVPRAIAHCSSFNAHEGLEPSIPKSLHSYQLDPSFQWAPRVFARDAVFAWARKAFTVQLVARGTRLGACGACCCSCGEIEYL